MADRYNDRMKERNHTESLTPAASEATYEQVQHENRLYFNIVKKRYIWFIVSLAFLIPSIISLAVQGLNLGIDFSGGNLFGIKFSQPVTQTQITTALNSVGLSGQVQLSEGNTEAIIRTHVLEEDKRDELLQAIEKEVGAFERGNLREDKVGPAIGAEMRSGAMKAFVVAAILILLYISLRFRFIYAVGGIAALLHDIVITLGIFSIFRWEIDAAFIAAILTVFGYSINDSVVIFDRIRENEKRMKKKDDFEEVVDKSVWQTMGRSIKTAGTVLIALFAIFILGGATTKVFALAMIIGVFIGTYSSIFIASQIVLELKNRFSGKKKYAAEG